MNLQRPFRGGWASLAATATANPATASVDTGLIRDRFNFDWATGEPIQDLDTYWWWARSIRVDPDEVIADDGEGNIWSVPFTTDGTDAVTFGEPVRVAETFVPVQAGEGAAATAAVRRRRQRVIASALDRPTKPDRTTNPAASVADERSPMDEAVRQALARQHGLNPESATEDDVNAAVLAANQTPAAEVDSVADQLETPVNAPEPVAAAEQVNTNLRDLLGLPATATADQVADAARALRDNATAGAQAARTAQATELDGIVDSAVRDGRIAPSARDAWRQAIDPTQVPAAAATTERERLAGMATNRVPVHERGAIPDPAAHAQSASLSRALAAAGVNHNGRNGATTQEVIRRG